MTVNKEKKEKEKATTNQVVASDSPVSDRTRVSRQNRRRRGHSRHFSWVGISTGYAYHTTRSST